MAKIVIVVTSTPEVTAKLAALQKKAELHLLTRYGHRYHLTHGALPFHITLVAPVQESKLEDGFEIPDQVRELSPVTLTGISIFMPNIVHAQVNDSKEELKNLHSYFHSELSLEPIWKPFIPHVTLAWKFPESHLHAVREAFEEYSKNFFPLEFPLVNITTYREEGGRWVRHQRHALTS